MQTIKITTAQNIDIDYEVAGLGERVVARLIDSAIFVCIFFLGLIFASAANLLKSDAGEDVAVIVLLAIYAALYVFYDLVCETTMNGQSVGKKVMKIRVISMNGARPTVGQYLLRWLFRIVDFTLTNSICALICVAVNENRQRVGDMVAGTTLIKTTPRTQIDNIAFMPAHDNYQPVFPQAGQLNDQDVSLIQEVIENYMKSHNTEIVRNLARKIASHLSITTIPEHMDSFQFLQTIMKDYNTILSAGEDSEVKTYKPVDF